MSNTTSTADKELFRTSIGKIKPIAHDKVTFRKKPKPIHAKTKIEEQEESHIELTANLENIEEIKAEETIFYAKPGLQTKLIKKLRQGELPIAARLDLHGLTILEARSALAAFLENTSREQKRHLLIIHGKGHHSKEQKTTIKSMINSWLRELPFVLAFCSAKAKDGGAGAVYVLCSKLCTNKR